jgi:hypothetical protein
MPYGSAVRQVREERTQSNPVFCDQVRTEARSQVRTETRDQVCAEARSQVCTETNEFIRVL